MTTTCVCAAVNEHCVVVRTKHHSNTLPTPPPNPPPASFLHRSSASRSQRCRQLQHDVVANRPRRSASAQHTSPGIRKIAGPPVAHASRSPLRFSPRAVRCDVVDVVVGRLCPPRRNQPCRPYHDAAGHVRPGTCGPITTWWNVPDPTGCYMYVLPAGGIQYLQTNGSSR